MDLTLGQKIKLFRLKKRLSQFDLEILLNDSPGSISRIENDKINPTKETIHAIATALKLTTEERASLFNINLLNESSLELIVEAVLHKLNKLT